MHRIIFHVRIYPAVYFFIGGCVMKRLLSFSLLLFSVAFILSLFPTLITAAGATTVSYEVEGGSLYFDPNTGTITDCDYKVTSAVIPSEIDGVPVVRIGYSAFYYCYYMTDVSIPDTVTYIGEKAFSGCSALTEIEIPDSVITIGKYAFEDCTDLMNVLIGSSMFIADHPGTTIDAYAFDGCSNLQSVFIGNNVTSIEKYAFYNSDNLISLIIGDRVSFIGNLCFYSCDKLSDVTLGPALIQLGDSAFADCEELSTVTIFGDDLKIGNYSFSQCFKLHTAKLSEGVVSIGEHAFFSCRVLKNITLPGTVTSIGAGAFMQCNDLEELSLSEGLSFIGDEAFRSCGKLKTINIPSTVTSIGVDAFLYCSKLDGIWVEDDNLYYSSDEQGSLYNKDKTSFLQCRPSLSGAYTVRDGVTHIGASAFHYLTGLTSVKLPEGVTSIAASAFQTCSKLSTVNLPEGLISIGASAFDDCPKLMIDSFPRSLIEIGAAAFADCTSLSAVILPDNLTSLGRAAFYGCTNLDTVALPQTLTTLCDSMFYNCQDLKYIYIPENVTSIGEKAFYSCSALANIAFGSGITTVEKYTFWKCSKLKNVYYIGTEEQWSQIRILDSNDSLSAAKVHFSSTSQNFYPLEGGLLYIDPKTGTVTDCDPTVISADIPETVNGVTVTAIGSNAFSQCTKLENVIIPATVTTIGNYGFYLCYALKNVTIPDFVTSIGSCAFYRCESLESVTIPNHVLTIGGSAFSYCRALSDVKLSDSITTIGSAAFSDCSSLRVVNIPDSVTTLGSSVFSNCTALTTVTIPKGVSSIGTEPFSGCVSLEGIWADPDNAAYRSDEWGVLYNKAASILIQAPGGLKGEYTIPEGVTNIGSGAFYGCYGLKSITIPVTLKTIASYAFYQCDQLANVYFLGSPEQWEEITISSYNDPLKKATIYHEDCPPDIYPVAGGVLYFDPETGTITGCDDTIISAGIPDEIQGVPVVAIGEKAFYNKKNVTSISIPKTVTSIGDQAFRGCSALVSISVAEENERYSTDEMGVLFNKDKTTLILCPVGFKGDYVIPHSVTAICEYGFFACSALTSVRIPAGVTEIMTSTFENCGKLSSVTIPDSVVKIGKYAFDSCNALKQLTIPYGVQVIEAHAFESSGLVSVSIPDSVITIGDQAFYWCSDLLSVTIPDSVTWMGSCVFYWCHKLESVTIGSGLSLIGYGAFYDCENLTSVTIKEGVQEIGDSAFNSCLSLSSVHIPQSITAIGDASFANSGLTSVDISAAVTYIGSNAFMGCPQLTGIWVDKGNSNYSSDYRGVLYNKDYTTLLQGGGGLAGEFYVLGSVTTIAENAFAFNTHLQYLSITASVKEIGDRAFFACDGLVEVTIHNGVTRIGKEAFYNCDKLRIVSLPRSINHIGERAFSMCLSLDRIYVDSGNTHYKSTVEGALLTKDGTTLICTGKADSSYYIIPEGVITLGELALSNLRELEYLSIPATLKQVGYSAFRFCKKIDTIFYYGTETQWKEIEIFGNNSSIQNANIRYGEHYYPVENGYILYDPKNGTITGCSDGISCVNIPQIIDGVRITSIGDNAFANCSYLRSVILPAGLRSIGNRAFYDTRLENIFIPDSVRTIGTDAFYGCDYYFSVYYTGTPKQWAAFQFPGESDSLEKISIHCGNIAVHPTACGNIYFDCDTATVIAADRGMKMIYIPETINGIPVRAIGDSAFAYFTDYVVISIPKSIERIGTEAFRGGFYLEHVFYGGSEEQWNAIEFGDWNEDLLYAEIEFDSCIHENTVHQKAKEANCAFSGTKSHYHCKQCGLYFSDDSNYFIILTEDQVFENFMWSHGIDVHIVTRPKCAEESFHTYGCTLCDTTISYKFADPIGHNFDAQEITKPATCTDPGVLTHICSRCNVTEAEELPPVGHAHAQYSNLGENHLVQCENCADNYVEKHSFISGECVCGAKDNSDPEGEAVLRFRTISLKGNIAINFYMELSEEVAKDENAYMLFTLEKGEQIKIPATRGERTLYEGKYYYVFTCAVSAKEMTDTVISQFFYEGGMSEQYSYSVKTYADRILNSNSSQALRNLIYAMLNYGAASQIHFEYHTERLANAGQTIPDYTAIKVDGFPVNTQQGTKLATYAGASLLLTSETTLRIFFQVDESVKEQFTVTYEGQELSLGIRSGRYYADIPNISAKDLDNFFTLTIYDGTETATVTYAPMSYCGSVIENAKGVHDRELQDVCAAMYLYNQAANAYFPR